MNQNSSSRKSVLFITRIIPQTGGGASTYSYDLLAGLKELGFEIEVLSFEPWILSRRLVWIWAQNPQSGFRNLYPGAVRIGRRLWQPWALISNLFSKIGLVFGIKSPPPPETKWGSELTIEEKSWVQWAARSGKWDAVIVNFCWLSGAFDFFDRSMIKAVLTHDVWHKHVTRQIDGGGIDELDREQETNFLAPADVIIAITRNDADDFKTMLPDASVVCAPMSCKPSFSRTKPQAGVLLFVGSAYRPNVEGTDWFMKEVAPLLEQQRPGYFKLTLVGDVGPALSRNETSIAMNIKGRVDKLSPEYEAAEIVLVPIFSGTGLKIKLVEALAHGKAIVTTSAGARGLEDHFGRSFLVADTPEQFASAIIRLSEDESKRIALERAAESAAREDFSPKACYSALAAVLSKPLKSSL